MPTQAKPGFGKRAVASGKVEPKPRLTKPGDKREQDRTPVFKNGKIILSDHSIVECVARNFSEKGCLISAAGAENLPQEVVFQLDAISRPRRAKVIWREQGEVGLEFLADP